MEKNKKKQIALLCVSGIALLMLLFALFFVLWFSGRIGHGKYPEDRFEIERYRSETDFDGDGIDDQTDILESVKAYLATNPQYMSKYYENGWPDDEYGVCTDVVARGLLGAGYDLQALVQADRLAHPERYEPGEAPDPKIDFRRVRNLLPYFQNHAQSLTTNPWDTKAWQPGDIVIWDGHVGVISENRNFFGVPYVYHHGSPLQTEYEQDILWARGRIVGHFRFPGENADGATNDNPS